MQSNLVWEDVAANIDHFDKLLSVEKLRSISTDLILLPEMSVFCLFCLRKYLRKSGPAF